MMAMYDEVIELAPYQKKALRMHVDGTRTHATAPGITRVPRGTWSGEFPATVNGEARTLILYSMWDHPRGHAHQLKGLPDAAEGVRSMHVQLEINDDGNVVYGEVQYLEEGHEQAQATSKRRDDGDEYIDVHGRKRVRNPSVQRTTIQRANGRCELCSRVVEVDTVGRPMLDCHHIEPLGQGGPDVPSNTAGLCGSCHDIADRGARRSQVRTQLELLRLTCGC